MDPDAKDSSVPQPVANAGPVRASIDRLDDAWWRESGNHIGGGSTSACNESTVPGCTRLPFRSRRSMATIVSLFGGRGGMRGTHEVVDSIVLGRGRAQFMGCGVGWCGAGWSAHCTRCTLTRRDAVVVACGRRAQSAKRQWNEQRSIAPVASVASAGGWMSAWVSAGCQHGHRLRGWCHSRQDRARWRK